jgi:hypothetical protein
VVAAGADKVVFMPCSDALVFGGIRELLQFNGPHRSSVAGRSAGEQPAGETRGQARASLPRRIRCVARSLYQRSRLSPGGPRVIADQESP